MVLFPDIFPDLELGDEPQSFAIFLKKIGLENELPRSKAARYQTEIKVADGSKVDTIGNPLSETWAVPFMYSKSRINCWLEK